MRQAFAEAPSMNSITQLNDHIKDAMRAKDKDRLTLLRAVKAAFKYKEIDTGSALSAGEEVAVIMKMMKERRESALAFEKGGAIDRAKHEEWEAELLETYLPPAPTDEEIDQAIDHALAELDPGARTPKAMGAVIKTVQQAFAGRPVDGKALSVKVKAKLA